MQQSVLMFQDLFMTLFVFSSHNYIVYIFFISFMRNFTILCQQYETMSIALIFKLVLGQQRIDLVSCIE